MREVVNKQKTKFVKDNSKKLNNLVLLKFSSLARCNVIAWHIFSFVKNMWTV